jgi:hypothetical protein
MRSSGCPVQGFFFLLRARFGEEATSVLMRLTSIIGIVVSVGIVALLFEAQYVSIAASYWWGGSGDTLAPSGSGYPPRPPRTKPPTSAEGQHNGTAPAEPVKTRQYFLVAAIISQNERRDMRDVIRETWIHYLEGTPDARSAQLRFRINSLFFP